MGILRTYFNKDTTLIRDSYVNTGRNPIVELFHGGSLKAEEVKYSRYIFDLDFSEILKRVNSKDIPYVTGMTHTLKMTNTSCFDQEQLCSTVSSCVGEIRRATCFDLILFQVPESWCEGNGYDYTQTIVSCAEGDKVYCEGPANWFVRGDVTNCWSNEGVYGTDPSNWCASATTSGASGTTICSGGTNLIIATQHFDFGSENVCVDVTDYINGLILSGYTGLTYGLGLSFTPALEQAPLEDAEYVGFFSRETNTVYEPFLETTWNDRISDDRNKFYLNKSNNICLYVNAGGQNTNATFSGVEIYDQNDDLFTTINSLDINQITRGVYCVNLTVDDNPTSGYCGNIQFRDVWKDVTVGSKNLGDVELNFIVLDDTDYYRIGSTNSANANGLGVGSASNMSIYDYEFNVTGVKRKEKIKRGDTRRVNVNVRIPYTYDQTALLDKVYYRIFIKEGGHIQIDYIDWQEISRTADGNYFLIDTSWFIPNDYFIEVKIESSGEVRTYGDVIPFEVVSEKDWC